MKLAFGALPTGVIAGATDETTVSITDDDDPDVTVSFGVSTYTAAEGGTATVTVTLSADPGAGRSRSGSPRRTRAARPLPTTRGCRPASPSTTGIRRSPSTFAATQDTEDDDGESVKLGFGTLPARVSPGSPSETTVSITDDDDPGVTVPARPR